jgi:hypothetical protein
MSLSLDISKFIDKTTKNADAKVRVICLDLLTGIVMKTPVDTGRARANWQASIGAPTMTQLETLDKGGEQTISASQDAVSQAPGNVFWITNNLPYIASLEYGLYSDGPKTIGGFSRQAPKGMARLTIDEVTRRLR